ncbi:MAG: hypothetical protein H0U27_11915 [Nitrosopumilus sp.]|nr:hypothetical protein [Nitrosopumilus sp.]
MGRIIDEITTIEQNEANLSVEKNLHPRLDQFNYPVLCAYGVSESLTNTNGKWLDGIINSHHLAVFVTGKEMQ